MLHQPILVLYVAKGAASIKSQPTEQTHPLHEPTSWRNTCRTSVVVLCHSYEVLLPSILLLDISDMLFYSTLHVYSNKLGKIREPDYVLYFLEKSHC